MVSRPVSGYNGLMMVQKSLKESLQMESVIAFGRLGLKMETKSFKLVIKMEN